MLGWSRPPQTEATTVREESRELRQPPNGRCGFRVEEATEGSVTGRRGVVATPKAECEATQAHARRARVDWLAGLCS